MLAEWSLGFALPTRKARRHRAVCILTTALYLVGVSAEEPPQPRSLLAICADKRSRGEVTVTSWAASTGGRSAATAMFAKIESACLMPVSPSLTSHTAQTSLHFSTRKKAPTESPRSNAWRGSRTQGRQRRENNLHQEFLIAGDVCQTKDSPIQQY